MNKLLAAIVVSSFAFCSASGFAADTVKKSEELTKEERADMRNRADKLRAERRQPAAQTVAHAPKGKEELTREEREELRGRADRLIAERARAANQGTPRTN